MLLVHVGIASKRQFLCTPTASVHSIKEYFSPSTFFYNKTSQLLFYYVSGYVHVEMNKFYMYFGVHLDDNKRHPILYH